MIEVAKLLSKNEDMEVYRQLAAGVKRSFNDKFFDKQKLQVRLCQPNRRTQWPCIWVW
jgi:hypothetical protein